MRYRHGLICPGPSYEEENTMNISDITKKVCTEKGLLIIVIVILLFGLWLSPMSAIPDQTRDLGVDGIVPSFPEKATVAMSIQGFNVKIYPDLAMVQADAFLQASEEFNIPVSYLVAVGAVESRFDPMAVSHKACVGVMQINVAVWLETLRDQGMLNLAKELYDPAVNIRAGAFVLRHYLDKHDSALDLALSGYYGANLSQAGNYLDKFYSALGRVHVALEEG
jgi:hypothetical protein